MSRPPIKAFEAVKHYCQKNKSCKGCPIHHAGATGYMNCTYLPENWEIKKEKKRNEK